MQTTPFDSLAIRLSEAARKTRGAKDKKLTHSITFIHACRVRYLHMHSIAEQTHKRHEAMFKELPGTRSISDEEWLHQSSETTEAKMSFFDFIEELNRFGRVFENEYKVLLPLYFHIRFYRNKMIEHWDQYEEYLNAMGNGYTVQKNKLIIPSHFGAINTPPRSEGVYQELSNEFKTLKITLPALDLSMQADDRYSKTIFLYLDKINQRLEGIPSSLVNTLFKYSFPVPIHDLESYITELVSWMENFTKEYSD